MTCNLPKQLKPRQKILLSCILFLSASVLFGCLVILPLQAKVTEARAERLEDEQQLTVLQNFINAHMDDGASERALRERELQAIKALPKQMHEAEILNLLGAAAEISHVEVTSFSPKETTKNKEGLQEERIEVVLSGDYFALLECLRQLEKNPRFLQYHSLKAQTREGKVFLTLDFSAFALTT